MRIFAFLRGLCPHCGRAPIFHSFWGMNQQCPHCAIRFAREEGFFAMSIFLGYVLMLLPISLALLVVYLLDTPSVWHYFWAASAAVVLAAPWVFRYARIWWLYIDEWLDPREASDK
jgi:uncharacterized protein (DUF983 family)